MQITHIPVGNLQKMNLCFLSSPSRVGEGELAFFIYNDVTNFGGTLISMIASHIPIPEQNAFVY